MQYNTYENNNNIIITEPSSNLRALGRNALYCKWGIAITAMVIYSLCANVPTAIFDAFIGTSVGDLYSTSYGTYNMSVEAYNSLYNTLPEISPISEIYSLLITGAFNLGICMFFLAVFRRHPISATDIFLGFENFGKALGLLIFQSIFVFLWALLFVVPGIIAAIRYSQAFFILADDPSKGIRQCMNESKQMMKGNKAKYFCLGLSFIGWALLAGFVAGLVQSIADLLYAPQIVTVIIDIISGLVMVPLMVYVYSTFAGFYEILAGHLIKETEPAPIDPEAIPIASENTENKDGKL